MYYVHGKSTAQLSKNAAVFPRWKIICPAIMCLPFNYDSNSSSMHLLRFVTTRAYARAVLGVVILSVRLSVTRVDCDKSKWCTADILISHERTITLLHWHQRWLVGDKRSLPSEICTQSDPPPSRNADFDRFSFITSQPEEIAEKVQLWRI